MKRIALLASMMATPAFAAGADIPWYSLNDTNFVVLIAFTGFIGVLLYFGVPKLLTKMLDDRAEGIKSEIDEARALREEAQTILASFERKHKEVEGQVEGIIEHAKTEAQIAADAAKADLKDSIARRLQAAVDQIASAEQAAVREVKDKAVNIAIAAAGEVMAANMSADVAGGLIDDAIETVADKLH
ncbi:MAG: F0F1 ATP synthase subunit B [Paracoccaceae bacterium]|jgi:F-type H+-transporting ATPase subunit b